MFVERTNDFMTLYEGVLYDSFVRFDGSGLYNFYVSSNLYKLYRICVFSTFGGKVCNLFLTSVF